MNKIKQFRKKIDIIDSDILKLLNKRTELAYKIGIEKKSSNIFRPERQAYILRNLFHLRNNKITPDIIFSYWRAIFLAQTKLQGNIKIITSKSISKLQYNDILNFFTHEVKIQGYNNINQALKILLKNKNSLLILPYPKNKAEKDWWTDFDFSAAKIIASLPFIMKKSTKPRLIILSKYAPVLDDSSVMLYKSNKLIKNESLKIEAKAKDAYLYKSKNIINANNLSFIGAYPENYEIK